MDSVNFAYWLQGFFEMTNTKNLTEEQVTMIKQHLALVFTKVTPPLPKEEVKKEPPGRRGFKNIDEAFKGFDRIFDNTSYCTRSSKIC